MEDTDLSCDKFLDGRLRLWQPRAGYRAGTDAVFLAAAVKAEPGQSVLDVGCGVGAVSLCIAARIAGVTLTGLERNREMAGLARRNAAENGCDLAVVESDMRDMSAALDERQFDHVVTNPPFFDTATHTPPQDTARAQARHGSEVSMRDWIELCGRRVRPKGVLAAIAKASSLPDMLRGMDRGFGGVVVVPIAGRAGRPAGRVLVLGRKGSRAAFELRPPLIVHAGTGHAGDRDDYSDVAKAVLRQGSALS